MDASSRTSADPLTLPGEPLHDLRSDGPGATCDENGHRPAPCCKPKTVVDDVGSRRGLETGVDGNRCRSFAANAVRLQLHALAYNLGNFMRTLAMPKNGGAVVTDEFAGEADQDRRQGGQPRPLCHVPDGRGRGAATMFRDILRLIARLRVPTAPA